MYKISSLLGGILLIATMQLTQAQIQGNSPYSKLGLGEVNNQEGNVRNFGMGNLGVAMPNSFHINIMNPALLAYNNRVTFEGAAAGLVKNIANSTTSQNASSGGLGYLAFSVPLNRKWRSAVGLRPFSSVSYQSSGESRVQNDPNQAKIITGESGEGNISEVYFANGFTITKGLTFGVTAAYNFGVIDRDSYSFPFVGDTTEQVILNRRTNYNGFNFKGGLGYRAALNKKLNLNLGATYLLNPDLNFRNRTLQERRTVGGDIRDRNYVASDSISGEIALPGQIQGGISLDNSESWAFGVEFSTRDWSKSGLTSGKLRLGNSYRVALGGEFTPDAGSIDSYFKRVGYRAGFSYAKTPVVYNGQQVNDMAIHAGLTLPLGAVGPPPELRQASLNLGIAAGRNGSTDNGLLRENYLRFMVGVSLNANWFYKRKID